MNARAQAAARPFEHVVLAQPTTFQPARAPDADKPAQFQALYQELVDDESRNRRICDDVVESVSNGRSPLVLAERNDHLDRLKGMLAAGVRHLVVLRAGLGKTQRQAVTDLQENGYRVLRFLAEDVGKELDLVLDAILRALSYRQSVTPPAAPLNLVRRGRM